MPEIRRGAFAPSAYRLGDDPVAAVYLGDDLIWPTPILGPVEVAYDDFSAAAAGTDEPYLPRTGWEADDYFGAGSTSIWRTYNDGSYKVLFPNAAGTLHYDSGFENHEAEAYFKLHQPAGVVGVAVGLHSSDSSVYVGWELVRHNGTVGGVTVPENKLVVYYRNGADHDEFYVQLGAGLVGDQWYKLRLRLVSGVVYAYLDDVLVVSHALSAEQVAALEGHTRAGVINFAGNSNYQWMRVNKIVAVPPIPPAITAIDPDTGPDDGGTTVRLTGTNFIIGATSVKVDSVDVVAEATSTTALTFTAPAHAAGAVNVQASTIYGLSAPVTFTYSAAAAPTLSGASPTFGEISDTITLTGTNFAIGSTWVEISGVLVDNADVSVSSATSLTFDVPADATFGDVTIAVLAPGGTSGTTPFTVTPPAPPTTNMVMWLDPAAESYANDDPVGSMSDQSPGGTLDASASLTTRPLYKTAGINGNPALLFDGTDDYLALPSGLANFTGGFTIFFVILPVVGSSFPQKLFAFSSSATGGADDIALGYRQATNVFQFQTQDASGVYGYYSSNNLFPGIADYTYAIVLAVTISAGTAGSAGSSVVYRNGASAGSGGVYVPTNNTRTTNWIGRSVYAGDANYSGYMGDIIMYDTVLSAVDVAAISGYLKVKYGI